MPSFLPVLHVNDSIIERLRPVNPRSVSTKAGRLSMRGLLDGEEVKVFEAFSEEHANFLFHFMGKNDQYKKYFPRLIQQYEKFIVCQWVPGRQLRLNKFRRVFGLARPMLRRYLEFNAEFFDLLHRQTCLDQVGFDYIYDFILPRFEGWAGESQDRSGRISSIYSSLKTFEGVYRKAFLSHPDLTPNNVIFEADDHIRIIDNELLGRCRFPFMDELNSLNALFLSQREIEQNAFFLKRIAKHTLRLLRQGHEVDMLNVWLMRKIGSYHAVAHNHKIEQLLTLDSFAAEEHLHVWNLLRRIASLP
ncbi:MAG: hypothetical protein H6860_00860 [Rhodospirillales bacterium]|nr:hypothetical protein [Rhodospirillales bacterium]